MIEEVLDIKMTDGEMETFVCRPDHGGPFPAIERHDQPRRGVDGPGRRDGCDDCRPCEHQAAAIGAREGRICQFGQMDQRAGPEVTVALARRQSFTSSQPCCVTEA